MSSGPHTTIQLSGPRAQQLLLQPRLAPQHQMAVERKVPRMRQVLHGRSSLLRLLLPPCHVSAASRRRSGAVGPGPGARQQRLHALCCLLQLTAGTAVVKASHQADVWQPCIS